MFGTNHYSLKTHEDSLIFMYGFLSWQFSPKLLDISVFEYLKQPFINWINSRGLLSSDECLVLFCKFHYTGISGLIVLQDVPSNAAGEELPFLSKDDCNYYMQGCKALFYFELNWLEWRHAFFLMKINPNFGRKLSLHTTACHMKWFLPVQPLSQIKTVKREKP